MALSGLMWWIDRWRKSTAYMDMTLEEQGAYRNLLDEAWLRGGALPSDERVLAKACGDAASWKRVKGAVLTRFHLVDGVYRNDTLDEVLRQSTRRAEKQKRYRAGAGNTGGNGGGNAEGNAPGNGDGNDVVTPPVTRAVTRILDLGRELSEDLESSRRERARAFAGTRLKVSWKQHDLVRDESGLAEEALQALYLEWDAELVATNEDFDTLAYLKHRATSAVLHRRPVSAATLDAVDECQRLHGGSCGGSLRHRNRMLVDAEKAKAVNA